MVRLCLFVVAVAAFGIAWVAAKDHSLAMYHVVFAGITSWLFGSVKK